MIDHFKENAITLGDPASNALLVTPDDNTDLPILPRCITVEVAGDLRMTFANGTTMTIQADSGMIYPFRVKRIHSTGTTATGVAILW